MRILGVVLAGGRSRRFGADKAQARYRGRALLDHAAAALAPLVEEVAVCGRDHPTLRSIPDRPAPDMGPLGGLAGALAAARAGGFDAVLTVPCDAPLIADALAALGEPGEVPVVLADLPVCGLWPVGVADALDARLASDRDRSAWRFARDCGARLVASAPIVNVNTPDDLDRLP